MRGCLDGGQQAVLTCVVIALPLMPAIKHFCLALGLIVMIFADLAEMFLVKRVEKQGKRTGCLVFETLTVLYAAAVVFGGGCESVSSVLNLPGVLRCICSRYFAFTGMWKFISRIRQNTKNLPEVTFVYKSWGKEMMALIDTGNELRDFASDDPVIIDPRLQSLLRHIRNGKKAFI